MASEIFRKLRSISIGRWGRWRRLGKDGVKELRELLNRCDRAEDLFRQIRIAWFHTRFYEHQDNPPGISNVQMREQVRKDSLEEYRHVTEKILNGEAGHAVSPWRLEDM